MITFCQMVVGKKGGRASGPPQARRACAPLLPNYHLTKCDHRSLQIFGREILTATLEMRDCLPEIVQKKCRNDGKSLNSFNSNKFECRFRKCRISDSLFILFEENVEMIKSKTILHLNFLCVTNLAPSLVLKIHFRLIHFEMIDSNKFKHQVNL